MSTKVYIIGFLIIDRGLYLTSKNFDFREYESRKFFVRVPEGKNVKDAEYELKQKLRENHRFKRIAHDHTKEIELDPENESMNNFLLRDK
jgi:hypothetical protein